MITSKLEEILVAIKTNKIGESILANYGVFIEGTP